MKEVLFHFKVEQYFFRSVHVRYISWSEDLDGSQCSWSVGLDIEIMSLSMKVLQYCTPFGKFFDS